MQTNAQGHTGAKIIYKHSKEVDYFYNVGNQKVRVTRDEATLRTKPGGSIIKTRLANLDVYCPNRIFDYRISINVEQPCECPKEPCGTARVGYSGVQ